MIAWLLAFLGFPPPFGIPGSLTGLFSIPVQRRFDGAAPGENQCVY
jgi:hypothetical protein